MLKCIKMGQTASGGWISLILSVAILHIWNVLKDKEPGVALFLPYCFASVAQRQEYHLCQYTVIEIDPFVCCAHTIILTLHVHSGSEHLEVFT